jgi:hypothetical protein
LRPVVSPNYETVRVVLDGYNGCVDRARNEREVTEHEDSAVAATLAQSGILVRQRCAGFPRNVRESLGEDAANSLHSVSRT